MEWENGKRTKNANGQGNENDSNEESQFTLVLKYYKIIFCKCCEKLLLMFR